MRYVLTCAGTGGHIYPAIAIANIILNQDTKAEIIFIGTQTGLENELVANAGFNLKQIRTGKLLRKVTLKNVKAIFDSLMGIKDSKKILKDFNPDLVIGTGGYICGPVMMAAKRLKIPYVLHESNAFPGITVKLMAKNAACVMVGFEEAIERFKKKDNVVYTGTPIKFKLSDFEFVNVPEARVKVKLSENEIGHNKKIVLVTGGSQGALKFSKIILDIVTKYLDEKIYFVLVTGKNNYDEVIKQIEKIEKEELIEISKYLRVEKYLYEIEDEYKAVDLCITRSGALTINELIVAHKPSVQIPYPYAAENHQLYNAKVLENAGAAKIILESDLTSDSLYSILKDIFKDSHTLTEMSNSLDKLVNINVDKKIYGCISKILKNR